jgi:hypothetical protein
MVSIFFPTKGKTSSFLDRCINSLISKSFLKTNYEIIFGVDSDDLNSINFVNNLSPEDVNYQVVTMEPMGYKSLYKFQNKMAEVAKGDFFWIFSDDVEVLTDNWDEEILKNKGEMYLCVSLGSGYDHWPYSLFPIISKKWYEVTGRISGNSQTDCWLGCIAYDLQMIKKVPITCNLFQLSDGSQHDTERLSTSQREDHKVDKKKIKEAMNATDIGEHIGFV